MVKMRTAALMALGVVAALVIADVWYTYRGMFSADRSAQITLTADQRIPTSVTIAVNMLAWEPPFRSLADDDMACDGIRLRYGPVPDELFSGYYGVLPATVPGATYHCLFCDWRGTTALAIPAPTPAASALRYSFTLLPGARLPVNQPFSLSYQVTSGTLGMDASEATDAHGHFTLPRSGGYGPNGGEFEFGSVAPRGLERGPGAIMVMSQRIAFLQISGWKGLSVIYLRGVSVPVMWV